jgi:outer membrane murein-binding lipoprotein Lpp
MLHLNLMRYLSMRKLLTGIAVSLLFILAGCGGEKEQAVVTKPVAKPVNNPLAGQQQLLKDAEAAKLALEKAAAEKQRASGKLMP